MNSENPNQEWISGRCRYAASCLQRAEAALVAAAEATHDPHERKALKASAALVAMVGEVAEAHSRAAPPEADLRTELERLVAAGCLEQLPGADGEIRYAATPKGAAEIFATAPAHQPPARADVHTREVPDGTLSSADDNAAAILAEEHAAAVAEEKAHRARHPNCATPLECALAGEPMPACRQCGEALVDGGVGTFCLSCSGAFAELEGA